MGDTQRASHAAEELGALARCIRVLKRCVRVCERERMHHANTVFVIALGARAVAIGEAILLLLEQQLSCETKVLSRSLLDAVIDMHFLESDSRKTNVRHRQLRIEIAVDRKRALDFQSALEDLTCEQFIGKHPEAEVVLAEYEWAKRDRLFQAPSTNTIDDKQWSRISSAEKMKCLPDLKGKLERLRFPIRRLGDAAAHSRPAILEQYLRNRKDGRVSVSFKPKGDVFFSRTAVVLEASLLLLVAADFFADNFYLGTSYGDKTRRAFDRLKRALQE